MNGSARELVVAGDVTVDWNLARVSHHDGGRAWTTEARLCAHSQAGGVALLTQVVRAVADGLASEGIRVKVHGPALDTDHLVPGDPKFPHAYALWSRFDDRSWRVQEFMGLEIPRGDVTAAVAPSLDPATADIVVLDDAAFGMRDDPERWPAAIVDPDARPWIVLKMQAPVASGALWEHLLQRHADRLIVIMTIDALRRTEVQISRELSWERTAQDLVWELVYNPQVNGIAQCAHAVVSFGAAGAALFSRAGGDEQSEPEAQLLFDPAVIEGMWERERGGGMIGATIALTAGVVRELLCQPTSFDLARGVKSGLSALRDLFQGGYATVDGAVEAHLTFPVERVVAELANPGAKFALVGVEDPAADRAGAGIEASGTYWTILRDRYPSGLDGLAARIVIEGPSVSLEGVPFGRFGKLLTVDRHEIEAFRSIRGLVAEYASRTGDAQMLSIAVFGSPGSGKSFGVKQVAQSLLPKDQLKILNFNVAQFDSFADFADALRQVRDAGLRGLLPVVFWDEFDTALNGAPLGWLRYFLAPMQDGEFQEGQIVHPIGRSVFVFAGGTASSMEEFRSPSEAEAFRAAKGPDFVSRLRGFVNVLGPNPRHDAAGKPVDDPYFIVRRAILLRSMLERLTPRLLHEREGKRIADIDPGVLHAFLHCTKFEHGARSMESIVATSRLAGLSTFERSSLPSEDQLDLHVGGAEFLALVEELHLEGELLERLASTAHEIYCEGLKARGYVPGPQNDEARKIASALRPWDELREEDRDASVANVRDIPNKLARIGCVMVPARGDEPAFAFTPEEAEALAVGEHERWCENKFAAGWQLGSPTDKDKRIHEGLVPWTDLPEDQREKDRVMVTRVPHILGRIGYTILRARRPERGLE